MNVLSNAPGGAHAHLLGEIGEVYSGKIAGRTSDSEITIYKSLGTAAQDLAAGHEIWRKLTKNSSSA